MRQLPPPPEFIVIEPRLRLSGRLFCRCLFVRPPASVLPPARENINFVRSVVEEHMKLDILETWDALAGLHQERNLIAYAVWTMRFGGDSAGKLAALPSGYLCHYRPVWRGTPRFFAFLPRFVPNRVSNSPHL
jgi:hypothetical protein